MINMNNDNINNYFGLWNQNNILYDANMILNSNNLINGKFFLQKETMLENQYLNNNNIFMPDNFNNLFFSKNNILQNEFTGDNILKFGFFSQFIRSPFIYDNNSNLKNIPINNYSNILISKYKENQLNNNIFIKNSMNNPNFGLNEKEFFNPDFNYIENKNKGNINSNININNNVNNNVIDNNVNSNILNSGGLHKKKPYKKKYLFKVYHSENIRRKRKVDKTYINKTDKNNEIKVLKYKKVVYVNSSLLNSYSNSKNIKKFNKKTFICKNKRSSRYRGVSKNGNQWQVLMMINKIKSYIGSYDSEELAARIYDILAFKYRGIKARTNFKYTYNQIKNICEADIDIKDKNIYDIIVQLIV